jgi:hypothetical protein
VPVQREDFRERRTDQIEAPPPDERDTKRGAALSDASGSISVETIGDGVPLEPDGATEAQTDAGLGPLLEHDTAAMTSPSLTAVDEDPTAASMIQPPSRRTIILAGSISVGLVIMGGLVGVLLRDKEEELEPTGDSRLQDPPVPVTDDAADARGGDGGPGPSAARVAASGKQKKEPSKLGRVEIDSNVPAVVRERNADLGVTPFSRTFSPGRHKLSVATPDGSASTEMDLVVRPGETIKRTVRLTPR